MSAAAGLALFVFALLLLAWQSWQPVSGEGDRLDGWYHGQDPSNPGRWTWIAWYDACQLSLQRSRARRGEEV